MSEKVFKAENNQWHTGFQMTFANGCTISIIFGKNTYSDEGHTTAEVAAWNATGDWMTWNDGHWTVHTDGNTDVMTHKTPDEVAMLIGELIKVK